MRKLFKTLVSVVLSLTFIFSLLNINANDVSADTITVRTGRAYSRTSDSDTLVFKPSVDGYYAIDSTNFPLVYHVTGEEYDDFIRAQCAIAFDLQESFEDNHRETFFFKKGESYRIDLDPGEQICIRKANNVYYAEADFEHLNAYLDEPFTLGFTTHSTVQIDSETFNWLDLDEGLNYTEKSVTLNLTDALDDNYVFHSGVYNEGYDPYNGDLNTGWISCEVCVTYKGQEYYSSQTFEVTGFISSLSEKCGAYTDGDYCINYHEAYDFPYPLFTVSTFINEPDISVSYQWYKKDPAKSYTGVFDVDKKYLTKLNGYNSKELWLSEALLQAVGEPTICKYDESHLDIRTDLACAVTFKQGNKTYVKLLDNHIYYMVQFIQYFNTRITAHQGDTVVLPKAGKYFGDDGFFGFTEMPEGFSYKFTWYNCNTIPNETSVVTMGDEIDFSAVIGNATRLGTGQSKSINTSNLTVFDTPDGKVSYVLCTVEPYYNGKKISSKNIDVGYYFFDIHYCDITINRQPMHYTGPVGSTAKFHVDAEGTGLTYQWQLKKGSKWANLSSGGANTATLSVKVDESKDGKFYRCLITDASGNTIATDEVGLWIGEIEIDIKNQPKDYVGPEGSTAKFTVEAEGNELTYQWQLKKGNKWVDLTSGGATTPTLSVKVDGSKDGKVYRCLIKNFDGQELATKEVSITVKAPDIRINTQPSDYTGPEGSTAKFTVAAEGEGLTYQWQLKKGKSWANLSSGGATTTTLSVKVDGSKDGKVYRCLITNAAGEELATKEVTINVKEPDILINTQPEDQWVSIGQKAIFSVDADGEGLTYQWQLKKGSKWVDLTSGGATTDKMTIKIDASKDGKVYRCLITNANGEQLASKEATIHVMFEYDGGPVKSNCPAVEPEAPETDVPEQTEAPVEVTDAAEAAEPAEAEASVEEAAPAPVEAPAPAPAEEPAEVPAEEPA